MQLWVVVTTTLLKKPDYITTQCEKTEMENVNCTFACETHYCSL